LKRWQTATLEEAAALQLAKSLLGELVEEASRNTKGLQQDLLFEILSQVNWLEIAEDLLAR
jgi:hypothetical protein